MNIRHLLKNKRILYNSRRYFSNSVQIEADKFNSYSSLRIYQDRSMTELLNLYVCNTFCQSDLLVDNAHKFYDLSKKVLGKLLFGFFYLVIIGNKITTSIVKSIMSKAFTAGETIDDLEKSLQMLNSKGNS